MSVPRRGSLCAGPLRGSACRRRPAGACRRVRRRSPCHGQICPTRPRRSVRHRFPPLGRGRGRGRVFGPCEAVRRPVLDPRRPALDRHHGRFDGAVALEGGAARGCVRAAVGHSCVRRRRCLPLCGGRRDRAPWATGALDRLLAPGRHPHMPFPVRSRRHPRPRPAGRSDPQCRLTDAQQRTRSEAHRAGADAGAVQCRAVRRGEVGDRDLAVGGDRDRAVQAGDVRVVERDVGVGGAADADLAAVQQVDAARVGARDHVQLGRGVVQLRVGLGLGRGAQGEHGAVGQRGFAEGGAAVVQTLRARVQHHRAAGFAAALGLGGAPVTRDRRGQSRRHRGQGRAGRRRDQHVAARGAAPRPVGRAQRVYDGQPDLHRRQRSLLRGRGQPPPPREHIGQYCRHPRICH